MTRIWTPNRPSFYMSPFGALVAACRPKMQQAAAFSPLDIAGLQLWLKADAGLYQDVAMTTPAVLDADPVGGWADQSLNGNHATQATAGKRPTLKLAIQNGKPVVRFDGTDDVLVPGANLRHDSHSICCVVALNATQPMQIFVAEYVYAGSVSYFACGISDATPNRLKYYSKMTAGDSLEPVGANLTNSVFALTEFIKSNAAKELFLNAVSQGTSTGENCTSTTTFTGIGALHDGVAGFAQYLNGDIAEVLVYNFALSDAQRQSVESYLNSRWAVY